MLEQIIQEEGTENPYAQLLFQGNTPDKEEEENTEYYHIGRKSNNPNNANMEAWSILGTKIHYPQHPSQNMYLHAQDSPDQLTKWDKQNDKPQIQRNKPPPTPVMNDYLDCYEEVSNYLHLDQQYDDNRDVTTTYLGTEHIYKTDLFNPEPSVPIYSNSQTWGQIVGGDMLNILLDTGAAKCYMSKSYYDKTPQTAHLA